MGGKIKPTPEVEPQSDRFLSWKRRLNPPIHPSVPHSLSKPGCLAELTRDTDTVTTGVLWSPWEPSDESDLGAQKPQALGAVSQWMYEDGHTHTHVCFCEMWGLSIDFYYFYTDQTIFYIS